MKIATPSFTLATYQKGDENAQRLALVLPGRLDTKDYAHMRSHVDYLAQRGYLSVSFDPPGTWESPGGIELFTTTNYIKAVQELIEYFGNKPTVLLGHSRGGTISILAGVVHPAVSAIVLIMATYGAPSSPKQESLKTGFELSYRDLPPGDRVFKEQKRFELPISYFADGAKYNIRAALRECRKPILMVYGTDDDFTDPENVKEVFKEVIGPKKIHGIKSGHDYRYSAGSIEEVNHVVGEFLSSI